MPEMRNLNDWAKETKQKAIELRTSAQSAARELFLSGDLQGYLDLLARMTHYDAYNLLLIYLQYPKATCLAGFKVWQKMLGENRSVLRPEWKGKGIDLIAPYTDYIGNGRYMVTWFAVKQFDVSQTFVSSYKPPASPYIQNEELLPLLQKSVSEVIMSGYHRSVVQIQSSTQLKSAGLPGHMNEATIRIRTDIPPQDSLHFLCTCLCELELSALDMFSPPQTNHIIQCIIHCLFQIWGIESSGRYRTPAQNSIILRSIPQSLQLPYLSWIQCTVRILDESISQTYLSKLRSRDMYM